MIVGVRSQWSVAVAVPVLASRVLAVQAIVVLDGQEINGGELSVSVIICMHIATLPLSSVAIHVRIILYPTAHPGVAIVTSLYVIVGVGSQKSIAVAVPVTEGAVLPLQSTVIFGGHMMTGGVLSRTVTEYWHILEFPQGSVALTLIKVVPTGNWTTWPEE